MTARAGSDLVYAAGFLPTPGQDRRNMRNSSASRACSAVRLVASIQRQICCGRGILPRRGMTKRRAGATLVPPRLHGYVYAAVLDGPMCLHGCLPVVNTVAIAVTGDGTLFIMDSGYGRVRRVGPEGSISTYFKAARLRTISLRSDGTLFVFDQFEGLTQVKPDGTFEQVLASLNRNWCGSTGSFSGQIVPRDDGSFLVGCYHKVILSTAMGSQVRIAGLDTQGASCQFAGDGGPAVHAQFCLLGPIVESDQGDIFTAYRGSGPSRIVRIRPSPMSDSNIGTLRIPSEDGSEIYEFDADSRHTRTLSALTGVPIYRFTYDPTTHALDSITDADNNATTITRSASEVTITSPFGQVTKLALDPLGHLASVTNPNGEVTQLAHSELGLLTDLTDARNNVHHFEYTWNGRLANDTDAAPGSPGTSLEMTSDADGWQVDITSPAGRTTRHRTDVHGSLASNSVREHRTITQGTSLATTIATHGDGSKWTTHPDGTKISVLQTADDPRWGVSASYAKTVRVDVGLPTTTHSVTMSESRTATLAVPNDPFSLTAATVTRTRSAAGLANATSTHEFAAGPPTTWTTTTPAGRRMQVTLDN